MRTPVLYLHNLPRQMPLSDRLRVILAERDRTFPILKIPAHRIRWVRTSATGGYWTTVS